MAREVIWLERSQLLSSTFQLMVEQSLVGREEQEEQGSVFFFLFLEDSLQDEEELLDAWLPIEA